MEPTGKADEGAPIKAAAHTSASVPEKKKSVGGEVEVTAV